MKKSRGPALVAGQVLQLPVDSIAPNPSEPSSRWSSAAAVQDLVASMGEVGQLQPVRVREVGKDRYQLVFGHRRWAAVKRMGWATVDAQLHRSSEDEGFDRDALVAENVVRQDMTPMQEASLVQQLLSAWQGDAVKVGRALGHKRAWVLRRANLLRLVAELVAWTKDGQPLADWPASWLEELALLGEMQQRELLEDRLLGNACALCRSIHDVQSLVRARFRALSTATWHLRDATLHGGACTDCPDNTRNSPPELYAGPLRSKEGRCREASCFAAKLREAMRAQVEAAKAQYGDSLVLRHGHRFAGAEEAVAGRVKARDIGADRIEAEYSIDPERQKLPKSRGGVPCLTVDGTGAGSLTYVRPIVSSSPKGSEEGAGPVDGLEQQRDRYWSSQIMELSRRYREGAEYQAGDAGPVLLAMSRFVQPSRALVIVADLLEELSFEVRAGEGRQAFQLVADRFAVWTAGLGILEPQPQPPATDPEPAKAPAKAKAKAKSKKGPS